MDDISESHHERAMPRSFPVRGSVRGWFFRVNELPSGRWQVRGRNRHGQTVDIIGDGPEDTLASAESEARALSDRSAFSFD